MLYFKPSKMKLVYIFGLMEMHLTELEACVIFQSLKDMRKTSENVFGLGKISEKNLLFVWSIFVITT